MPRNIGIIDQVIRAMLGLAIVAYALKGEMSFYGAALCFLVGGILFATALFRYCPLYGFLDLTPRDRQDRSA